MADHRSTVAYSRTIAALLQQLLNYLPCPHWSCPNKYENRVPPKALMCAQNSCFVQAASLRHLYQLPEVGFRSDDEAEQSLVDSILLLS
eukprot:1159115-Pelagomonas_calceolata.AAC.5